MPLAAEHPVLHWSIEAGPIAGLAVGIYLYVRRFRAARREAGGRGAGPLQAGAFALAMLILATALISPLDRLGEDYLFAAHMAQHILLGDLGPLLVLLSLSRVIMRPATRRLHGLERRLGALASPVTFILIWLGLIYLWHIPALYVGAIESAPLHALEHVTFFTAGILVWWPLIQPVPMRRPLKGIAPLAYIFSAKVGLGVLGIYLTWSSGLAYDHYGTVPRIWGLDPVEDQNVGGAMMMVEQAVVLVIVLVVLFARMLRQSEEEERRRERLEDAAAA
jgi:cytochrome c oxidase assembly factor CtaG